MREQGTYIDVSQRPRWSEERDQGWNYSFLIRDRSLIKKRAQGRNYAFLIRGRSLIEKLRVGIILF